MKIDWNFSCKELSKNKVLVKVTVKRWLPLTQKLRQLIEYVRVQYVRSYFSYASVVIISLVIFFQDGQMLPIPSSLIKIAKKITAAFFSCREIRPLLKSFGISSCPRKMNGLAIHNSRSTWGWVLTFSRYFSKAFRILWEQTQEYVSAWMKGKGVVRRITKLNFSTMTTSLAGFSGHCSKWPLRIDVSFCYLICTLIQFSFFLYSKKRKFRAQFIHWHMTWSTIWCTLPLAYSVQYWTTMITLSGGH